MRYTIEPLPLPLKTPFRIAHGTSTMRTNVLVRLADGVGEGALPPYYPYSFSEVRAYLESVDPNSLLAEDPGMLEDALDRLSPGPPPARTALDLALHDNWGRHLGLPLYRLWGLNPARAPLSAITLSLPEHPEALIEQIQALPNAPLLKLKLGLGDPAQDEALVRLARETTDAGLCVDANGAWTVDQAARLLPRLAAYDLLFIEQPVPADAPDAWHQLRRRLPSGLPPLFADESIQTPADILALADAIDGVNLKLAKAGGLRPTRRMIALARALGLQVMLGCMIESSIALTAAAHLAPLVDFADLDSYLHLAEDPFAGTTLDEGRIRIPDRPGLGVIEHIASP